MSVFPGCQCVRRRAVTRIRRPKVQNPHSMSFTHSHRLRQYGAYVGERILEQTKNGNLGNG
ncbi:hypothetical protein R69749_00009 [Paraburkholderia domus]|uniref:Uncharacterized protein n=1 Tax=Paraburkholderia domus TaxID=2793075 RepID=A0A9N8MLT6_9BURK|nr:hypothetical protein R75483_00855 [Paraburkholderia domus]CAE6743913.1 hypothetical protein R69749_00009 [Paraburkholderia domus]CAE6784346.1 hypothetical protein R70006_04558 [Paraburkholderia domus]CAE6876325.1 hypothetical protein R70211_01742 [Paraburkholderia domus]CAE6924070.1 hypothetical protein R70199_05060 [Paraburkholderia domus]